MKPQGYVPPSAAPSAHEGADLDAPLIVRIGVILGLSLAALLLAVTVLFHHFDHVYPHRTSEAAPIVTAAELPPDPRVQMDPHEELQLVRAEEDRHLERYAWVDRGQGIAQIPIERAMALWVKTYVPPPAATGSPAVPAPSELQLRQQKAQEAAHAP